MAQPAATTTTTHPYTCLSCSLAFTDAASQREHYQTELHRYNSKRRVAGLAPISLDLFNDKVAPKQPVVDDTPDKRPGCKACK